METNKSLKINLRKILYYSLLPLLILSMWCMAIIGLPTFDLDESLYRRAAEEMKLSGNFWLPSWDGEPLFHKPPILYWLIIFFSTLIDGANAPISALASRLPSVFSTLGIFLFLKFYIKNYFPNSTHASTWFATALFPIITSAAVIFDPLQTLFLMPVLILFSHYFSSTHPKLTRNEIYVIGLSLFGATAIKGLNGLIIPALAFFIHSLITWSKKEKTLLNLFQMALKTFFPALILSAFYYLFLDQKMGREFTREFFFIHHLGRSQEAMETHGGSIFYHPIAVLVGGTLMIPAFLQILFSKNDSSSATRFPITYALSFILFFTFSATKLPHYTWPIWPAIALQCAISSHENKKWIRYFSSALICVWGLLILILALEPTTLLNSMLQGASSKIILSYFPGFGFLGRLLLFFASAIMFVLSYLQVKNKLLTVRTLATSNLIVACAMTFAIAPVAKKMLYDPIDELSTIIKQKANEKDCIRFSGPHSPSLSLALGQTLTHNRCDIKDARYLIAPEWKTQECKERGMQFLAQSQYLFLCVKSD